MRAVLLSQYSSDFDHITVEEKPVPAPGKGQVLVRVVASPINPSDLMFLAGRYGVTKRLPTVPGFEASAVVVGAGPGLLGRMLLGRRVACASQSGDGVWAQYAVVPAAQCLPLSSSVDDEQGATMLVNPFTAWALIETAHERNSRTIVATAAGSALGQMIWRLGKRQGVDVIGVVRRPEQSEELRLAGMRVYCTADPDMDKQLAKICRQEKITLAVDAVAGETATRVAQALAPGGAVIVYGALSLRNPTLSPSDLIFAGKSLEGFWLTKWFQKRGLAAILFDAPRVQRLIGAELHTKIQGRYSLDRIAEALADYTSNMSEGKVLITPQEVAAIAELPPRRP